MFRRLLSLIDNTIPATVAKLHERHAAILDQRSNLIQDTTVAIANRTATVSALTAEVTTLLALKVQL